MRFILAGGLFLLGLPAWAQFGGVSLPSANLPRPSLPSLPSVQAAPTLPSVTSVRPAAPRMLVNPTAAAPTPEGLCAPPLLCFGPLIQPPDVSASQPVPGPIIQPVAAGYEGFLEPAPMVNQMEQAPGASQRAAAQAPPQPAFGPLAPAAVDLKPVLVQPIEPASLEPAMIGLQPAAAPRGAASTGAAPQQLGPAVPRLVIPVTDLFARPVPAGASRR